MEALAGADWISKLSFPQLWQLSQGHPLKYDLRPEGTLLIYLSSKWLVIKMLAIMETCPYSYSQGKKWQIVFSVKNANAGKDKLTPHWILYSLKGRVNSCEYFINTRSIFTNWAQARKTDSCMSNFTFQRIFHMFGQHSEILVLILLGSQDIHFFLIRHNEADDFT